MNERVRGAKYSAWGQVFWVSLGILIGLTQLTVVVTGAVAIWLADSQGGGQTGPLAVVFQVVLLAMGIAVFSSAVLRLARDQEREYRHNLPELILRLERINRGLRESVYICLAVTAVTLFVVLLPGEFAGLELERALLAVMPGLLFVLFRQQEDASLLSAVYRAAMHEERQRAFAANPSSGAPSHAA